DVLPGWARELPAAPVLRLVYGDHPPAPLTENLELELNLFRYRNGAAEREPLAEGASLSSADLYRLPVRPAQAGPLYVFQVDTFGKLNVLFPKLPGSRFSTGENPVRATHLVNVPQSGKLRVDANLGVEHLFVVFSPVRWPNLEDLLALSETKLDTAPV